ncbi:MAG: T9SS type A sorting domain-containing protein [Flavobacteriales bacterium]
MKKLYISALMLVGALGAHSQDYVFNNLTDPIGWPVHYPGADVFDTIDVIIYQSDSGLSGTWRNDSKFAVPKNAQGDITTFGNYGWDAVNSLWVAFIETNYSYTYDGSNQITGMERSQGVGAYTQTQYATYTMDGSGNYTFGDYIDTIKFGATTTFRAGKDVMNYNGSGELTTRIYSESSTGTVTPLEAETKYTFTWTSGNVTEVLEQDWDGSSAFEDDQRQTFTYDANGRMTQMIQQYWDGSAWQNDEKEDYTYDANGRILTMSDYVDTSGSWANEDRTTYTYSGGMIDEYIIEKGNGTSWENDVKYKAFYESGEIAFALGYLWDGTAFESSAKLRVLYNDTTAVGGGAPNPPTNLSAGAVGRSPGVSLNWTDNSTDEDGFKVERSTDGTIFSEIASVGMDTVSYSDTASLTAGTVYYYRVLAYNAFGVSAPSNTADATTWALAVAEIGGSNVSVYPNPANAQFTLDTDATGTYTLRNIQGAVVQSGRLEQGLNQVNVEEFPNGVYFLEVNSAETSATIKIIFN